MKPEEANVYREIQKNTEMAIKAIDALSDKAYEDDFALQISRQSLKYSDIRGKAMDKLLAAKAEPVHQNYLSDAVQYKHKPSGGADDTGQQPRDYGDV